MGSQLCYVATLLYVVARFNTRASILLFCIKVFSGNQRPKFLIAVLVLGAMLFVTNLIVLLLECQPLDYIWLGWDGEHSGHCVDQGALYYAVNGIGMAYDVLVIFVPLPYILRLQLATPRRIMVASMFSVGLWYGIPPRLSRYLPMDLMQNWTKTYYLVANPTSHSVFAVTIYRFKVLKTFLDTNDATGR